MNERNLRSEGEVNNELRQERIYFPELDGLRFFAFFLVFLHHHTLLSKLPYLSSLYKYGWIGVDLFFTLSAFLFTKLLIAEFQKTGTIDFRKFYVRRIFRIWPVYYFLIFLSVLLSVYLNEPHTQNTVLRIVGLCTFTDNIISTYNDYNELPFIGHFWTISYEEQFYIFIPFIIILLVRTTWSNRLISFLAVFFVLSVIRFILIYKNVPHPTIWVLPVTHFESILLGIVIGFGGLNFIAKRINPIVIGLIGLLFFVFLCQLPNIKNLSYSLILSYGFVGISTALVLLSVLNSDLLKKFFSQRILVFLGKRSYGLYLFHLLGNEFGAMMIEETTFLPSRTSVSFLYSLVFTIIISIISYWLIEMPFLKMKKKFEVITSRPV